MGWGVVTVNPVAERFEMGFGLTAQTRQMEYVTFTAAADRDKEISH